MKKPTDYVSCIKSWQSLAKIPFKDLQKFAKLDQELDGIRELIEVFNHSFEEVRPSKRRVKADDLDQEILDLINANTHPNIHIRNPGYAKKDVKGLRSSFDAGKSVYDILSPEDLPFLYFGFDQFSQILISFYRIERPTPDLFKMFRLIPLKEKIEFIKKIHSPFTKFFVQVFRMKSYLLHKSMRINLLCENMRKLIYLLWGLFHSEMQMKFIIHKWQIPFSEEELSNFPNIYKNYSLLEEPKRKSRGRGRGGRGRGGRGRGGNSGNNSRQNSEIESSDSEYYYTDDSD